MPKKGKKGTDQRVKGNVKAASSGRMSELLGDEATGFIGFDSVSPNGGLDEQLLRVDGSFQVVMKQLGKRDPTTKLKALNEFISLCEREPAHVVSSSLLLWPLMYTKLCMDNDHRVRECSHLALQSCVLKTKKNFAPHIKSLIGYWLAGINDPHPSSATAALSAFTAAFTPLKQIEAIQFGFRAIMNFSSDIILKESPDTFSDPKVVPEDERVQRYERAVVMAILGLTYAMQRLEKSYLEEPDNREIWLPLIKEKRLWKLIRHSNSLIRNAVYSLIIALSQHTNYVSENPQRFCPLVLSNLGEGDPSVVKLMWKTTLLLLSTLPNWFEYVNVQKALLPGLWALLDNGGFGNTKVVYPCLLPLFHQLLVNVYSNDVGFAINFINRLKGGFDSLNVKISSVETSNVSAALIECSLLCVDSIDDEGIIIQLMSVLLELVDMSLMVSNVQYEEIIHCIVKHIEGLIGWSRKKNKPIDNILNDMRGNLLTKLVENLKINHIDTNVTFIRITDLLKAFYTIPSEGESTTTTPLTLTGSFVLPVVTALIAKSILLYKCNGSPQHILVAQKLTHVIGPLTTAWIEQVLNIVNPTLDGTIEEKCIALIEEVLSLLNEERDNEELDYILDCFINILYAGAMTNERVYQTLTTTIKTHINLLPMITVKISKHANDLNTLMHQYHLSLLLTPVTLANRHYWEFLRSFYTDGIFLSSISETSTLPEDIVKGTCQFVSDSLIGNENSTTTMESCRQILQLLLGTNSSILNVSRSSWESLLLNILSSIMSPSADILLVDEMMSCYVHIASNLPDVSDFIWTTSHKVIDMIETDIDHSSILLKTLCFYGLNHSVIKSTLELFQNILLSATQNEFNYITSQVLSKCCSGEVPFVPSLSPLSLCLSFPLSLTRCVLPLIGTTHGLQQVVPEALVSDCSVLEVLLPRLPLETNLGDVTEEVWQMGVVSCLLIIVLSQPFHKDELIGFVSEIATSSLSALLEHGNSKRIIDLVKSLLNKPNEYLSVQCLKELVMTKYKDTIVKCILESDGLGAAISILDGHSIRDTVTDSLLSIDVVQQDPCLISILAWMLPDLFREPVISVLNDIIEEHNKGELPILDDYHQSCHDPVMFSIINLFRYIIIHSHDKLGAFWDFISCTLFTLVQFSVESIDPSSLESVVLSCNSLVLVESLHSLLTSINEDPSHLNKERSEWTEFFSHSIVDLLCPLFLRLKATPSDYGQELQLYHMCRVIDSLSVKPLGGRWEELVALVTSRSSYPEQLLAYKLARRVLLSLKIVKDDQPVSDNQMKINTLQSTLDAALDQVDLALVLSGDGGSEHHTVGYMLLWLLLVESTSIAHLEERVLLIDWIKESLIEKLHGLLKGIFQYPLTDNVITMDAINLSLIPSMAHLSGSLYLSVAVHMPQLLRQWYLSLDHHYSSIVSSFTTKHISGKLWQKEVQKMSANTKVGNLEVRVCGGVSEIVVVYRIDEFTIELTLCIPDNYPLAPPVIREGKKAKVEVSLWRKWLLQLSSFVANQNGSIMEGLMLWKSNLDNHFSGLEDCMICFSIIHGSNYSLPKMICRTCKKRFHSSCLYKWFNTSNKSSCPLCRNVF